MKKFIAVLTFMSILSLPVFAGSREIQKEELAKLRNAKNAQDSVLNSQINAYKSQIEKLTLDESISQEKKDAQMQAYAKKIEELSNKKLAIKIKYKKDKTAIKKKY